MKKRYVFILTYLCFFSLIYSINLSKASGSSNEFSFILPSESQISVIGNIGETILETGEINASFSVRLEYKDNYTYNFYGLTLQIMIYPYFSTNLFFNPIINVGQVYEKEADITYDVSWEEVELEVLFSCIENRTIFPSFAYNSTWVTMFSLSAASSVSQPTSTNSVLSQIWIPLVAFFGSLIGLIGFFYLIYRIRSKISSRFTKKQISRTSVSKPLPSETRPCSYCGHPVLKKIKVCPNCLKVID